MKISLFSGLKTRVQVLGLAALVALAAGASFAAAAQEPPPPPADSAALPADAPPPPPADAPPPPAAAAAADTAAPAADAEVKPDHGDVAWMLVSTLLVLLMTVPGVALFYGGLVRSKNVLSVLAQVTGVYSLLAVLWVAYGYSFAFTGDGAWIGSASKLFLKGIAPDTVDSHHLPELLFVVFQMTFAGITGTLFVGSFAERAKFGAVLLFAAIWFTLGYVPLAHIVWGGGYLGGLGALDFAGGTVVHLNAGVAGLIGAYFLGKRVGYGKEAIKPHSVTFTYVGAMLLWVGWFGFNAGSELAADGLASLAFINTMVATAAALLAWSLAEKLFKGHASVLGIASGAVAGLVAITPACGFVGPLGAIVIGAAAGFVCLWGVTGLKKLLGADDSLDVFGVHGIGGALGAILTGVFAAPSLGGTGGPSPATFNLAHQVGIQFLSVGFTVVLIGVVSIIGFTIAKLVFGLRVSEDAERQGLDITTHGEAAYEA
ncbi:MAG: ammonium transporter [Pseudoxanthomonas sp.]